MMNRLVDSNFSGRRQRASRIVAEVAIRRSSTEKPPIQIRRLLAAFDKSTLTFD